VLWYDQSGHDRHASQSNPTLQPLLDPQEISLTVEDGQSAGSTYLEVPPDAANALATAPESSLVIRTKPDTELAFHEGSNTLLLPLLSASAPSSLTWDWRQGTMTFAAASTFKTLSFTTESNGSMAAYVEGMGSEMVGQYTGTSNDTYISVFTACNVPATDKTMRVSGEVQHLYMFDAVSLESQSNDFGFRLLDSAGFYASYAYVNSETLVFKEVSHDMISLLPTPAEGSGQVIGDDGVTDRIRHVAGEHLWQMNPYKTLQQSNLEQEAFSNSMALRGPGGDLVLWGQAFMSNSVWIDGHTTLGSNVRVVGGSHVMLSNSDSLDIYCQTVTMSNASMDVGRDAMIHGDLEVESDVLFRSNLDVHGHFVTHSNATFLGVNEMTGSFFVHSNSVHFSNIDPWLVESTALSFTEGSFVVNASNHARFLSGLYATTPAPAASNGPGTPEECGVYIVAAPEGHANLGVGSGMYVEGREDKTLSLNTKASSSNGSGLRRLLVHRDGHVAIGETPAYEAMFNIGTNAPGGAPNLAFQDLQDSNLRHVFASDHVDDALSLHLGSGDFLAARWRSADGLYVPTDFSVGCNTVVRFLGSNQVDTASSIHATLGDGLVLTNSNVAVTVSGEASSGMRIEKAADANAVTVNIEQGLASIYTSNDLVISTGSNTPLSKAIKIVSSNNYVGIGISNAETPQYPLHVHGLIFSDENIVALSDRRVKSDIRIIPDALDRVCQLSGYTFVLNDHPDKRSTGLIAQEVQAVLPEAVTQHPDSGLLSLAYGNMVGVLVQAVKELRREVAGLRALVT